MSQWTFNELLEGSGGDSLRPATAPDQAGRGGVAIDSRTIQPGQVFLCIRGDRTDGHAYIEQALAQGAAALIVERNWAEKNEAPASPGGVIVVDDALIALQNLARYHRNRLQCTVLGVTGSNGKTSTKEMLSGMAASLLGKEKVFATHGNLNNHIGLPLSVLAIDAAVELAILEMGMNHPGEISLLAQIARPHQAMITSVSGAHQEFFSSVEEIARAKLEILDGLEPGGTLLFHLYSQGGELALDLIRRRKTPAGEKSLNVVFFGGWPDAGGNTAAWPFATESIDSLLWDERLSMMERVQVDEDGIDFAWQGGRVHCANYFSFEMAENLLGALSLLEVTGKFFPDQLRESAADARPLTDRRFQVIAGAPGKPAGLLVDDSYNANPDSFRASLRSLRELKPAGRLALFAGEMAELGAEAVAGHRAVGAAAAAQGYELIVVCGGDLAREMETAYQAGAAGGRALRVDSVDELPARLSEILGDGFDGVLVKGSRSARMDLISDALRDQELV